MCSSYSNQLSWAQVYALLTLVRPEAADAPELKPQYDIRPLTQQWVIRRVEDGAEAVQMRWGLVPWFHKGRSLGSWKPATFAAPVGSIKFATAYKRPFARRRCLVPASGWSGGTGRTRTDSHNVCAVEGGEPVTFAGLWDSCETSDCGVVESFAIVTQALGAPLDTSDDRAPMVIRARDRDRWLTPGANVVDLIGPEGVRGSEARPAT